MDMRRISSHWDQGSTISNKTQQETKPNTKQNIDMQNVNGQMQSLESFHWP
jgi:hypothetical protein